MEEKKKSKIGLGILIGAIVGLLLGASAMLAYVLFSGRMITSADPTKVAGISETDEEKSAVDESVIRKMKLIEEKYLSLKSRLQPNGM